MSTPVQIVPGSLPEGYCYPSGPGGPQQFNVDIVTRIVAQLADTFPGIWVGPTAPPPAFQDRVWFHTGATKWYYFINGIWQRKYDIPYDSKMLMPFWGSAADVDVEGGGSPGAVGISSGPLWAIDHTMDGRTWFGVGAVPGSDPALTLNEGDTSGAGSVALALNQIPYHGHNLPQVTTAPDSPTGNFCNLPAFRSGGSSWRPPSDNLTLGFVQFTWDGGDPTTHATVAHSNLTPCKAGYWLRRTIRQYVQPPY